MVQHSENTQMDFNQTSNEESKIQLNISENKFKPNFLMESNFIQQQDSSSLNQQLVNETKFSTQQEDN